MSETKHAKLSASGSKRWILCPGSVAAQEGMPDVPNQYSLLGEAAHTVAAKGLEWIIKRKFDFSVATLQTKIDKIIDDIDLSQCNVSDAFFLGYDVIPYILYVVNVRATLIEPVVHIEKTVDFSNVVPEGFGTPDCVIYDQATKVLHVIDFKYGLNKVYSKNNTQLLLYAIGFLNTNGCDAKNIQLHIVQPRVDLLSNIWELSIEELEKWKDLINASAVKALEPNAPRIPSDSACTYCKAMPACPAVFSLYTDLSKVQEQKEVITNEQIKFVLDSAKLVSSFIEGVKNEAYLKLQNNESIAGYKLTQGKNFKKFKDDAMFKLEELLGENAYVKKSIGIGEAERLLGKEQLEELIYFQRGKPLLVKEKSNNDLSLDNEVSESNDRD